MVLYYRIISSNIKSRSPSRRESPFIYIITPCGSDAGNHTPAAANLAPRAIILERGPHVVLLSVGKRTGKKIKCIISPPDVGITCAS